MNSAETEVVPLCVGSVAIEHIEGDRSRDSHRAGLRPVSNWAWATAPGHYDWMDSYAPLVSLD